MKNLLHDILTSFIHELSNMTDYCYSVCVYDLLTNPSMGTGGDGNKMVQGWVGMDRHACGCTIIPLISNSINFLKQALLSTCP